MRSLEDMDSKLQLNNHRPVKRPTLRWQQSWARISSAATRCVLFIQ